MVAAAAAAAAAGVASDLEHPGAAVDVLGVFPQRGDARAEKVRAVAQRQAGPGEVVVDFVKSRNVGDRVGQERRPARGRLFGVVE